MATRTRLRERLRRGSLSQSRTRSQGEHHRRSGVDTIAFFSATAPRRGSDSVFDTESQVGLDDTLDAFLRGIFCRLRHATRGAVVAGVMTEAIMVFDLATSRRTRTSGTTEGGSKWQRGRGAGG